MAIVVGYVPTDEGRAALRRAAEEARLRATRLVVSGRLPGSGEAVEIETDAFEARAFQHEIDHLDGLLFLDRVAGGHALHPRKVYL